MEDRGAGSDIGGFGANDVAAGGGDVGPGGNHDTPTYLDMATPLPTAAPASGGGGDLGGFDSGGGFEGGGSAVIPENVDYGTLNSIIGDLRGLSKEGANPNIWEMQGFGLLDQATSLDALQQAYARYFDLIGKQKVAAALSASGYGRSGAMGEAMARAAAGPSVDLAKLANQRLSESGQARLAVGGQLPQRQLAPLQAGGQLELGKTGQQTTFNLGSADTQNRFNLGQDQVSAGNFAALLSFLNPLATGGFGTGVGADFQAKGGIGFGGGGSSLSSLG